MGRSGKPRKGIELMMTPMIDVIFLLLIFFLTTSNFDIVEKLLPSGVSQISTPAGQSNLPPSDPTEEQVEQLVIKLMAETGSLEIQLNGQSLTGLDDLISRLHAVSELKPDIPVVIDPVQDIQAEQVILVYDGARNAGLNRVYLATR